MSGDRQREEPPEGVATVGATESGAPSSGQVPHQGDRGGSASAGGAGGPADAAAEPVGADDLQDADRAGTDGGTVLPGPWPARPADPTGAVPAGGPVAPVTGPGAPSRVEPPVGSGRSAGISGDGEGAPGVPAQREGRTGAAAGGLCDADLIRNMRGGDDEAYEELFRRHSAAVHRYARTCCRDAHTADDLTAEVFARTLQAVRGGKGPEEAVRAYLMTAVRHVAAAWSKSARREHLVDDFAVFASQATRSSELSDDGTIDLGADVAAMHEAEQSMAMQAFRSLPERWQAVLWHTTVEEESPSEVAPLLGLTPNATAVLASRAREGLKQAYLQAHVSQSLVEGGDCARYADRLGAHARGGLRTRAERGLRKHLEECAKCRVAAGELQQVNAGIPALLPIAVIGWFAVGYSLKAAGVVAGGTMGVAGAGAAAAAGHSASAGGAAAGSASSGSTAGGAASEGLGAPAKAGVAATVAVAAAAGLVWALVGDDGAKPEARPEARPPAVAPEAPAPVPPAASPSPAVPPAAGPPPSESAPSEAPSEAPSDAPTPVPTPTPADPSPEPSAPAPSPTPEPPSPSPSPTPEPPAPAPEPAVYRVAEIAYGLLGDHTEPEVVLGRSTPIWQRQNVSVASTAYAHGVTVGGSSSVVIELNRQCTRYEARAGIDDLALGLGAVRFSVYGGDSSLLWRSGVVRGGDPAVPVSVAIDGQASIRLVVESAGGLGGVTMADWAESHITCA
ncbi:sigma-70 family RNA polymerase sigma factor [uncultured Streptomyces sp.]|uniref:sigma-70 family RNA polymerase sigma factor n=1 Tax=uncultured Streptomyces sp. TaxID=174707 RepID=UPI00260ECEBA|nr:sigma-70 family RNA polymerase sigma factor [uncultured Streptomyces sp.]